jgi:ubiquinone/menaquinone biosynthesis C-methylase UbiE
MAEINYGMALYRTMTKVFVISKNQENKILTSLTNILKLDDRDQITQQLLTLISPLKRKLKQETRIEERISTITSFLNWKQTNPQTILDIGAGTGEIILGLKNHYHLPIKSIFAIDQKLPDIDGITPLNYIDDKIPLPDNSVDVILLLVVLHHIEPDFRVGLINEIKRILAPNGVVIIREHDDNKTHDFFHYLDVSHIFWYLAENETPDPLYLLSRDETSTLFKNVGLASVNYNTYEGNNPQRLYYEMFIKTKNIYQFTADEDKETLQNYLNSIKLSPNNLNVIPKSLQNKYKSVSWSEVVKDVGISIIFGSLKYAPYENGIYYISAENINQTIKDLS